MYKSSCPRWYGMENAIRHIVVAKDTTEDDVKEQARFNFGAKPIILKGEVLWIRIFQNHRILKWKYYNYCGSLDP